MAIATVRLCHNFYTATDRIFPIKIITTQECQSQLQAGKTLLIKPLSELTHSQEFVQEKSFHVSYIVDRLKQKARKRVYGQNFGIGSISCYKELYHGYI